jgi:Domain of unknown function (DUF4145)
MKNSELIEKRFKELEEGIGRVGFTQNQLGTWVESGSFAQWATNVLNLLSGVFGSDSIHFENFKKVYDSFGSSRSEFERAKGIFRAAKSDFMGGYAFSVEASLSAEIFGDFIALAKQALSEGHKDVAAVLASAALEDTLKKFAALNGLTVDDQVMQSVVSALKAKGLVGGAQKSLLDTMPKIRDFAMHANWSKITSEDVSSVIGFTEQFLLSRFST